MRDASRHEADPSFDLAFDDLAAVAHRVAYRILGSAQDAEDVAQEALARALARWAHVADHAQPWVARVAMNLALDRWRRNRLPQPIDGGCAADESQVAAQRLDLVRSLRKLSRRQREVVVLRFLADRSEAETADSLGCSPGSVKQHTSRALAALRSTGPATLEGDQP